MCCLGRRKSSDKRDENQTKRPPQKRDQPQQSEQPKPPKSGLFDVLEDEEANKAASTIIIAVHGLGGNWRKTWESDNDKWNWVQYSIGPRLLEETGVAPRVLSFGYDSKIFATQSVTDIRQVVEDLVERLYNRMRDMDNKSPRVVFIAHSLGGLVVKKALNVAWNNHSRYGRLLSTIKGCIFLGVPHRGADLASWAKLPVHIFKALTGGSLGNEKFLKSLEHKSSECMDISRDFVHRAKDLQIRTFYETEKFMNQIIVDQDSAVMYLPNEVVQLMDGSNHLTICKFSRNEEQRYQPVWDALRELVSFGQPDYPTDSGTLPSYQTIVKSDFEAQNTQIAPVNRHDTKPPQGLGVNGEDNVSDPGPANEQQGTYSLNYSRLDRCLTCGTEMHSTDECPWLGKDDLRCEKCHQFGHYSLDCRPKHSCPKCRSRGHREKECRFPDGCFTCGQYDHWEKDCLWKDQLQTLRQSETRVKKKAHKHQGDYASD